MKYAIINDYDAPQPAMVYPSEATPDVTGK